MSNGVVDSSSLATHAWVLVKKLEDVANAPAQLEQIKQQTKSATVVIEFFDSTYNDFQEQVDLSEASNQEEWKKRAILAQEIISQFHKAIKNVKRVVKLVIKKDTRLRNRLLIQIKVAMNKSLLQVASDTMALLMIQMTTLTCICILHRENVRAAEIQEQDQSAALPTELIKKIERMETMIQSGREEASAQYRTICHILKNKDIIVGPKPKDMKEFKKIGSQLERRAKVVVGVVETPLTDQRGRRSHRPSPESHDPDEDRRREMIYYFMGSDLFEARFDSNDRTLLEESPQRSTSTRSPSRSRHTSPSAVTSSSSLPSHAPIHPPSWETNPAYHPSNSGRTTRSASTHHSAASAPLAADKSAPPAQRKQRKQKLKHENFSEETVLKRKQTLRKMKTSRSAVAVAPFTPSDAGFPDDE